MTAPVRLCRPGRQSRLDQIPALRPINQLELVDRLPAMRGFRPTVIPISRPHPCPRPLRLPIRRADNCKSLVAEERIMHSCWFRAAANVLSTKIHVQKWRNLIQHREFVMAEKSTSDAISRRTALSLLGLAALAVALPSTVLMVSDAAAQQSSPPVAPPAQTPTTAPQTGTERRQGRRTRRVKRRVLRRTARKEGRMKRRQLRRTGTEDKT